MKRRVILVSAYACEPLKGSEQGVGWNWVLQMAKNNDLHVITRANNQDPIEAHIPESVAKNIYFHYYDAPPFIKGLKNKAKGLYFYYLCWQIGIIGLVRKLKKKNDFDYSIHLTFGSMWLPTFLPLFNIPFIWGPVGGGEAEPRSFFKILPLKPRLMQYMRVLMNKFSIIHPGIMIPAIRAKKVIVRTKNSLNVFPEFIRKKAVVFLETAMEDDIFNYSTRKSAGNTETIRIVTTGRLMPSKNIASAVKALKHIDKSYNVELVIIGSGVEKKNIEREIDNQFHTIRILSEISRSEVLDELQKSDIYVFPSLREGGSWALMEAMAVGLPVVCLNWAGMEIITNDDCAIRLPVSTPEKMPEEMALAICKLIDNPELRESMGQHGRKRIKEVFSWQAKGEFMDALLTELDG